ncbi:hypothetical protein EX895_003639 [Sporisorium graminicola]|uniref:UNC-45/Cro1/She4 central domain-containing protein n=1 Tax=Sporisorium graminicola TaxID=280036 RepID=A0A4U7KVD8_9BASI|nr:hypothetical protein EX895_003639 [Sporisorium graminicola]TKY86962.1 hypothetical protein EX895_003639 [Sporisorium graminicola]
MQDELVESIRRFSVSDDPLSTATAHTFVDAFGPLSYACQVSSDAPSVPALANLKQARSAALLTLASRSSSTTARTASDSLNSSTRPVDEDIARLLTPVIRSRLADTTPHSLLSALHFLSALFSVLPAEAHDVLTADGIIDLVLEAPDACNAVTGRRKDSSVSAQTLSDEELVGLAVAELLSSAANSTATRKYLAGQQAVLDWLDIACVSHASSQSAKQQHRTDAIAIIAGLADIKVYQAAAAEAMQGLTQSASTQPTSQQEHIRKIQEGRSERQRKDEALYRAVQAELLQIASIPARNKSVTSSVDVAYAEIRRAVELSCLEVLAYLTVQSAFKERVAADRPLLEVLCTSFDFTAPKNSERSQNLDLDSQRFDGALQLGLATILANVTAYPPTLTAEEKQVRRLRNFANAQGDKKGDNQTEENDPLETAPRVEKRCAAVLEAKGVETLCSIATAGPPPSSNKAAAEADNGSWKVNPSRSVRRACGDALLALLTKQDRVMRGKAVQQGALKAVLALSAPILHKLQPSDSSAPAAQQSTSASNGLFARSAGVSTTVDVTSEDLAPLQALAKLLISLNPSLLFPSSEGLSAVAAVVCTLLLCQASSRLQRFEALLALTNLASLSPEVCRKIAAFSLNSAIASPDGTQDATKTFSSTSVLAQACEQLLMEDHVMVRRAWIELLVNLLQVESVFDYFVTAGSSSTEASSEKAPEDSQDRLSLRLRMLLGLSEVDGWAYATRETINTTTRTSDAGPTGTGEEPSLATRMVCLAILAMVTESTRAVEALLTLPRLFPVLLTSLVLDRSEDEERNEQERADLQPLVHGPNRSSADIDAEVQLNGINLSLRASYVLISVLQHLAQSAGNELKYRGGYDQVKVQSTLQETLSYHVKQLQQGSGPAQVQEARKGLLQVVAECLKVVQDVR